jgi:hypothetical protein
MFKFEPTKLVLNLCLFLLQSFHLGGVVLLCVLEILTDIVNLTLHEFDHSLKAEIVQAWLDLRVSEAGHIGVHFHVPLELVLRWNFPLEIRVNGSWGLNSFRFLLASGRLLPHKRLGYVLGRFLHVHELVLASLKGCCLLSIISVQRIKVFSHSFALSFQVLNFVDVALETFRRPART